MSSTATTEVFGALSIKYTGEYPSSDGQEPQKQLKKVKSGVSLSSDTRPINREIPFSSSVLGRHPKVAVGIGLRRCQRRKFVENVIQ